MPVISISVPIRLADVADGWAACAPFGSRSLLYACALRWRMGPGRDHEPDWVDESQSVTDSYWSAMGYGPDASVRAPGLTRREATSRRLSVSLPEELLAEARRDMRERRVDGMSHEVSDALEAYIGFLDSVRDDYPWQLPGLDGGPRPPEPLDAPQGGEPGTVDPWAYGETYPSY